MPDASSSRTRRWAIGRLAMLVLFVAIAAAAGFLLPPLDLESVRAWATDLGWAGAVTFLSAFAALTLTPVPKNVLSIAAGVVWGFGLGLLLVYVGALIGAAASFLIGRGLGRDAVERLTGQRVARLDDALARRGFLAVLGVRLVPIVPFTLINYGAGLTAVRVRDYALGTALGIIPGSSAYVALGAFGFDLGPGFWIAVAALGVLSVGGAIVGLRLGAKNASDAGNSAPGIPPASASASDPEAEAEAEAEASKDA